LSYENVVEKSSKMLLKFDENEATGGGKGVLGEEG
jgi:hypothetical protein